MRVTPERFRHGMRRLSAAVSVVTTDGPAGRFGITASSVCAVAADPPTLLVCLNRGSAATKAFRCNGVLCANTLAAGQQALSDCFAGLGGLSMPERFAGARWSTGRTGAPILVDSLVSFDCRMVEVKEIGTHSVMFCMIEAIDLHREAAALVYVNRAYHTVELAAG
jgi:flavin reductase